ncbi:MAG: hypothetical protein QXH27_02180 [Candidatus Micrarchaeia archaeon]
MRGQAAVELIVILSLSLAVLAVIVAIGYGQLSAARHSLYASQAQASLNALADAAAAVSQEGVGSRREVAVIIPPTVVPERVFIDGRIINMGLWVENGTTDVNVLAPVSLQGRLPNASGDYIIPVEAREGFVLVGSPGLTAKPTFVHLFLRQSSSQSANVTFFNTGSFPITVSNALIWTATGVTASVSPSSFVLAANSSANTTLSFTSGSALGAFGGRLNSTGDNGESMLVDIIVDVVP